MTRTNAVVIALATELAATRADAARLTFEILAPRNQDAADGQDVRRTRPAWKRYRLLEQLGVCRASQEKTTESRRNHPTL